MERCEQDNKGRKVIEWWSPHEVHVCQRCGHAACSVSAQEARECPCECHGTFQRFGAS